MSKVKVSVTHELIERNCAMPLFVSYSYASMDNENALFGSQILDEPAVDVIRTDHDKHLLEEQVLATFGQPDAYRWVQILNAQPLPLVFDGSGNRVPVTGVTI